MPQTKELEQLSNFICFISQCTQALSSASVEKLFSAATLTSAAQCRSSLDFVGLIESLDLPELDGKELQPQGDERSAGAQLLDVFLETGELPSGEQRAAIIDSLQQEVRKSLYDHVADGAMTGAAVGAAAGAAGGGLVTAPVGGVGSSVGAMAGALAGGVGGAVGGAINWALGRD